jgi:hypothetical protein
MHKTQKIQANFAAVYRQARSSKWSQRKQQQQSQAAFQA